MKKERDWSVSYTISWGGVNQCPKWGERALLLMWHIRQLIAAAIENEGLPFIFCWPDGAPSFNLSFPPPLTISFFICGFDQCLSVLLIFFPFPPLPVFIWVWLHLRLFFFFFAPNKLILLSGVCRQFFSEAGYWGWGLVFCLVGLDCLCGCVASTACIQACVCVPVQCCVQGTETCPNRWTTRGLFPIIPLT